MGSPVFDLELRTGAKDAAAFSLPWYAILTIRSCSPRE